MRKIGSIVVIFLAAVLTLPGGILFLNTSDVKCGSEVMHPGDICETTRRGRTTENTYEQQKRLNTLYGYGGVGFGLVFLGVGVWQIRRLVQEKKEARSAAPASEQTPTTMA